MGLRRAQWQSRFRAARATVWSSHGAFTPRCFARYDPGQAFITARAPQQDGQVDRIAAADVGDVLLHDETAVRRSRLGCGCRSCMHSALSDGRSGSDGGGSAPDARPCRRDGSPRRRDGVLRSGRGLSSFRSPRRNVPRRLHCTGRKAWPIHERMRLHVVPARASSARWTPGKGGHA